MEKEPPFGRLFFSYPKAKNEILSHFFSQKKVNPRTFRSPDSPYYIFEFISNFTPKDCLKNY
jgi:hypothetical protein